MTKNLELFGRLLYTFEWVLQIQFVKVFLFLKKKKREGTDYGHVTVSTYVHNDKSSLTKNESEQSLVKTF